MVLKDKLLATAVDTLELLYQYHEKADHQNLLYVHQNKCDLLPALNWKPPLKKAILWSSVGQKRPKSHQLDSPALRRHRKN